MSDNEKRIDQILRELDQVNTEELANEAKSVVNKTKNFFNPFHYFWVQITTSALYIWNKFLRPVWGFMYDFGIGFIWRPFRKVWDKLAFSEVDGKRVFNKKKGASILMVAAFLFYFMINILSFFWHTTLYFTTARVDEIVYLSNAQEVDPENNIFSVQGCEYTANAGGNFSCSQDESLYFRIEPTEFAQVWSLFSQGTIFYPDYIAAPIAPGWQKCTITSYGFRIKTMIRRFEIYPEMLSARCGPIVE